MKPFMSRLNKDNITTKNTSNTGDITAYNSKKLPNLGNRVGPTTNCGLSAIIYI